MIGSRKPNRGDLRVAIVGAGPAGIFAAEALTAQDEIPVHIDLIDRLPAPFGLVRHGVAPDHILMRAMRDTLRNVLSHDKVRFIGNVEIGIDLALTDLLQAVDAVIYAFGAAGDRKIGIDGEDIPGVLPATSFVSWYTGHPDAARHKVETALSSAHDVVVVGVGNVALDVARLLARSPEELTHTDMPQHVLEALAAAPVRTITILGRRGPAQASFTTPELRELGRLDGATVIVEPDELADDAPVDDKVAVRNIATLRGWASNVVEASRVTIQFAFFSRPLYVHGHDRVTGIEVERTEVTSDGNIVGSGQTKMIPADLVIRSVGYRGHKIPGIAVDADSGTILNKAGRILRDGAPSVGEYVAGWIKRGPSGVVGTNKQDARETVTQLLDDVRAGVLHLGELNSDLVEILTSCGAEPILLSDWDAIDAAERDLGATRGRDRTVLHLRDDMLGVARGSRKSGDF